MAPGRARLVRRSSCLRPISCSQPPLTARELRTSFTIRPTRSRQPPLFSRRGWQTGAGWDKGSRTSPPSAMELGGSLRQTVALFADRLAGKQRLAAWLLTRMAMDAIRHIALAPANVVQRPFLDARRRLAFAYQGVLLAVVVLSASRPAQAAANRCSELKPMAATCGTRTSISEADPIPVGVSMPGRSRMRCR